MPDDAASTLLERELELSSLIAAAIVVLGLIFGISIALTNPMEIAATVNPVTYVMEALRSIVLEDLEWGTILPGFAVVAALGALALGLNVRMIRNYD